MGLTTIYGHQLMAAWDLGAQGPTTQQLTLGRNDPSGYPYDLSQNDDVLQVMGAITRIDSPVTLRERVDRGDIVFNYGAQFVYRNQGTDREAGEHHDPQRRRQRAAAADARASCRRPPTTARTPPRPTSGSSCTTRR